MQNSGNAKVAMRRKARARIASIGPADRARAAESISGLICEMPEFMEASRVALYAAMPDELPTMHLFDVCRRSGKHCLLPRIALSKRLEFAVVERWDQLKAGQFGILEPHSELPSVALSPHDLVFVPGLAFSPVGERLGRGGGYYDRTLSRLEGGTPNLFGLGYRCQLVSRVPTESHDLRLQGVVTEAGIARVQLSN